MEKNCFDKVNLVKLLEMKFTFLNNRNIPKLLIQQFSIFFALYDMTCRKRKQCYLNILGKPGNLPKPKLYGQQIGTKFN